MKFKDIPYERVTFEDIEKSTGCLYRNLRKLKMVQPVWRL